MLKLTRRLLLATAIVVSMANGALAQKLKVVASFSILADMTSRIGGELIEIASLVGPNGDAHVFEPAPASAKEIAAADLVLVNGLGFEGWIERLLAASGFKGVLVTATRGIASTTMAEGESAKIDPHAWQSVANAVIYIAIITEALCGLDDGNCDVYKANAEAYTGELSALDAEIKAAVARVPMDRRTVIMSHDAFGYFARAYGITVLAPEGVSTDSEASARDVAALIEQIKVKKAAALFVENVSDPRLIEQISRETGLAIGGELYTDALSGPGGPAPTYIEMMRHNARMLTEAMAGS